MASEDSIQVVMVGTAVPEAGLTHDIAAARIRMCLIRAMMGQSILTCGMQDGPWLSKFGLKTHCNAGEQSWKYFKAKYSDQIEINATWYRWSGEYSNHD